MAKLVLGKTPEKFKRNLTFQMLDGSRGSMEVTYKYRSRKAFGALMDELSAKARQKNEQSGSSEDGSDFSLAEVIQSAGDNNVEYIMKIVDDWNLDIEFDEASVQQLCDECPSAANAIMETYRTVIMEGRSA